MEMTDPVEEAVEKLVEESSTRSRPVLVAWVDDAGTVRVTHEATSYELAMLGKWVDVRVTARLLKHTREIP